MYIVQLGLCPKCDIPMTQTVLRNKNYWLCPKCGMITDVRDIQEDFQKNQYPLNTLISDSEEEEYVEKSDEDYIHDLEEDCEDFKDEIEEMNNVINASMRIISKMYCEIERLVEENQKLKDEGDKTASQ